MKFILAMMLISANALAHEIQFEDIVGKYKVNPKGIEFTRHEVEITDDARLIYKELGQKGNSCEGKLDFIKRCYSNSCMIVRAASMECKLADGEIYPNALGYEIVFEDSIVNLKRFKAEVSIAPLFTGQGNYYSFMGVFKRK